MLKEKKLLTQTPIPNRNLAKFQKKSKECMTLYLQRIAPSSILKLNSKCSKIVSIMFSKVSKICHYGFAWLQYLAFAVFIITEQKRSTETSFWVTMCEILTIIAFAAFNVYYIKRVLDNKRTI